MKQQKEGFTLIELLVVIAVIGLLASIVAVSTNNIRKKGRDARRLSDMSQIVLALDLYYDDHNDRYPSPVSGNSSWETSFEDNGDFMTILETSGYMAQVPLDPINTSSYYYGYYRYNAGYANCDVSRGAYYVLGILEMEILDNFVYTALDDGTTRVVYQDSPGWHCPEGTGAYRDWQDEFDWVTGKFEK